MQNLFIIYKFQQNCKKVLPCLDSWQEGLTLITTYSFVMRDKNEDKQKGYDSSLQPVKVIIVNDKENAYSPLWTICYLVFLFYLNNSTFNVCFFLPEN